MPAQATRQRQATRAKSGGTKKMTLGAHLTELRRRVVRAAAAVVVGSVAGWFVSSYVLAAMRVPITTIAHQQHRLAELNYDNVTAAFDLRIQIAITVGVIVSSPIWLYQLWAFFVPALTRRELKYALGFFFSAVPLFLVGCAAGWILVPHMVELMTSFAPAGSASFIQASDYFTFILKLVVAVGVAFVLPVFLVLLNFVGVMSAHTIIRSWRIALIAIVVFTAIVTPSADVISMFLLAIPIIVLYLAAGGIAVLHDRRKARADEQLFATEFVA
jgi:sec-independent protein translocase protein TatC